MSFIAITLGVAAVWLAFEDRPLEPGQHYSLEGWYYVLLPGLLATGTLLVLGHVMWSAFRLPTASAIPGVPQSDSVGEARTWLFARTAANGKVVLVQCTLLLPRDIDPAALPSRVQQAASEFAPIIKSISVETISN